MQRTIILIIGGIIITVGVVAGGIVLWKSITKPGGILKPTLTPSPTTQQSLITTISEGNVRSPTIDLSGTRILFYDAKEKRLKETDFSRAISRIISNQEFRNIIRVIWAPTSTLAILEYKDEFSTRKLALLDITSGSTTPLSENIKAVAWSKDATQIAYHWNDGVENAIFISSPDSKDRRKILPIQLLSVNLFWISPDTILVAEKPTPEIPSLIFTINIKTNETKMIFGNDRFGASVLPSPDGKKLLISSIQIPESGKTFYTEIYDLTNDALYILPFSTLAEKCTWSSDSETVFCAIPTNLDNFEKLPFSYWTGEISSNDYFATYRFTTGEFKQLSDTLNVDAIDLVIPRSEDAISFINKIDGLLTIFKPY